MTLKERQAGLLAQIDQVDSQLILLKGEYLDKPKLAARLRSINSALSLLEIKATELKDAVDQGVTI